MQVPGPNASPGECPPTPDDSSLPIIGGMYGCGFGANVKNGLSKLHLRPLFIEKHTTIDQSPETCGSKREPVRRCGWEDGDLQEPEWGIIGGRDYRQSSPP